MAEDFIQQAIHAAPVAGTAASGSIIGTVAALLAGFRIFAKPADVDLAVANLKTEIAQIRLDVAEKYVSKEMFGQVMDKLDYIQDRVDLLADRK